MLPGCYRHVTNRLDRNFRNYGTMERQLEGVAKKFKNLLFNAGKKFMRILDTGYNLRGLEDADVWCMDPRSTPSRQYTVHCIGEWRPAYDGGHPKIVEDRVELNRRREHSLKDSLPHNVKPCKADVENLFDQVLNLLLPFLSHCPKSFFRK
jgi:hypothetical protein